MRGWFRTGNSHIMRYFKIQSLINIHLWNICKHCENTYLILQVAWRHKRKTCTDGSSDELNWKCFSFTPETVSKSILNKLLQRTRGTLKQFKNHFLSSLLFHEITSARAQKLVSKKTYVQELNSLFSISDMTSNKSLFLEEEREKMLWMV